MSWFFRIKLLLLLFFSSPPRPPSFLVSDFIINLFCPTTLSHLYFWILPLLHYASCRQCTAPNPKPQKLSYIFHTIFTKGNLSSRKWVLLVKRHLRLKHELCVTYTVWINKLRSHAAALPWNRIWGMLCFEQKSVRSLLCQFVGQDPLGEDSWQNPSSVTSAASLPFLWVVLTQAQQSAWKPTRAALVSESCCLDS